MEIRFDGRVALVTGGARGIGAATAHTLLDAGAAGVAVTSHEPEDLEAVAARLDAGERLLTINARVEDEAAAASAVSAVLDRFGRLDVLVNHAGTDPAPGSLADADLVEIDQTWAVYQRAPLVWSREAWNRWMREHGGAIVNAVSTAGFDQARGVGADGTSKAAVLYLTRQLAMELAPGVRVNTVALAGARTTLSAQRQESGVAHVAAADPLEPGGDPQDVANAIAFLASDAAAWITGVVLPVGGGGLGASAPIGVGGRST